jgi:hypothetical protein
MNDPDGIMFPHLEAITPLLKHTFSQVFVSVPLVTQRRLPEYMLWLQSDDFFHVINHESDVTVDKDFLTLYANAASSCDPAQILHLCFIDRVAFALQSEYRDAFITDIQNVTPDDTPLIFQRSELAWQTHPQNYRDLEQMVTKAGKHLFGKSLDFAWCHIAIQAGQLLEVIPAVKSNNISFFAEIVLAARDEVKSKAVDWLAWEDPFITSRNPQELKKEREASIRETQKRLGYVIPMLQLLVETSKDG